MVLTPEGPRSMQNVEILYFLFFEILYFLSAQWSHLFILTLNFRDFFILLFGWSDPTIFLYYPSIKAYNGPWGWRGWYFRLRQIKLWIHACQPANHHWQGNTREFCVKALLKWIIDKEGTTPKWDMETGWTIEI